MATPSVTRNNTTIAKCHEDVVMVPIDTEGMLLFIVTQDGDYMVLLKKTVDLDSIATYEDIDTIESQYCGMKEYSEGFSIYSTQDRHTIYLSNSNPCDTSDTYEWINACELETLNLCPRLHNVRKQLCAYFFT